jgi:glycosyltransferase involved in cell wall biosynthesis
MPKKRKLHDRARVRSSEAAHTALQSAAQEYDEACTLAERGELVEAKTRLILLQKSAPDAAAKARIRNDLATLAFLEGDSIAAQEAWTAALAIDAGCESARANLAFVRQEQERLSAKQSKPTNVLLPQSPPHGLRPVRVAILSFLFNWPTTGGGNVHTYELALFLARAGYEVKHWYVKHPDWGIGNVPDPLPFASEGLEFTEGEWNAKEIQHRFRSSVERFDPDHVILTDSWNFKPLLAEAVSQFPYILRFQAMECLCPLNNIRLLPKEGGGVRQCHLHQLATPNDCVACIDRFGQGSGSLHQLERALSGVGTAEYQEKLVRAFRDAEAVLVVNPLTEAMMSPYTQQVRVATSGFDPDRFPWPNPRPEGAGPKIRFLFAGLVQELMKGFDVLHRACTNLWSKRQDFELVATGDPPGQMDDFTRFVGWKSQEDLPASIRESDVLMMPTIAQEALGRTAVEAMAAGRPVIASRLGGLPYTVAEGSTGLLCEPGDAEDLARKMEVLLDDPDLRARMGLAGRRRFEEHYAWPVIIDKHYKPLLDKHRNAGQGSYFYRPEIAEYVDQGRLLQQVADCFQLELAHVRAKLTTYRSFYDAKGYAKALGERKTLCLEEAFVLYVLLALRRPKVIVEIGTQHGKSARRILDMASLLGLEARLICFDIQNEVQHFAPHEATLVERDVTGRFRTEVLEQFQPDLLFVDVHTYHLLKEVVHESLVAPRKPIIVMHDCSAGLCNPNMTLSRGDTNVTSLTGIWERHVLAEEFGVSDPKGSQLDDLTTATARVRVFSTPHGIAIIQHSG